MYMRKSLSKITTKCNLMTRIFIAYLFLLHIVSCTCASKQDATLGMNINNSLLIGNQTKLAISFEVDSSGNAAILQQFKLKGHIVDQKDFNDQAVSGSQMNYTTASGELKTFDLDFEAPLSELSTVNQLDPSNQTCTVYVSVVPDSNAVCVEMQFELLDQRDQKIQDMVVKWIKSEILIRPASGIKDFHGENNQFVIKNLKEDMTDLSKYSLSITTHDDDNKNPIFHFEASKETTGTLQDLLGTGLTSLKKDTISNPINIKLAEEGQAKREFVEVIIKAYLTGSENDASPLGESSIEWFKDETLAVGQPSSQAIKNNAENIQKDQDDIAANKQNEARLKEAEKQAKAEYKETIKTLENQKKEALKKETVKQERKKIKQKFENQKKDAKHKLEQELKQDQEQIKQSKKQEKEDKKAIKKYENEDKEVKKQEKERLKHDTTSPPAIKLIMPARENVTHKYFELEIQNEGRKLTTADLEQFEFWYVVQGVVGDAGNNIAIKYRKAIIGQGQKNKLSTLLDELNIDKKHKFKFELEGLGSATELTIKFHLAGHNSTIAPISIPWKKHK
jgi:hypothetical protein